MPIRVLIADDQPLVRAGLAMLLAAEPDLEVLGEVADGPSAVERARELNCDIVLMDVRMPGGGVEATRIITQDPGSAEPDRLTKVIILTTYHDEDAVYAALRAGASGFLLKDAAPDDLVSAVRAVSAGDAWLDPPVARRLLKHFAAQPDRNIPPPATMQQLTPRERDVLILVAHGQGNTAVARNLGVGEATIKTHMSRIFMKLGLRDRTQAVVAAYQSGLVKPGDEPPQRLVASRRPTSR